MTEDHDPPASSGAKKRQRIAKLIARAGLCSRRDAETWIVDGRVSVNGTLITSPALDVASDDAILVDGVPLPTPEKTRLFLFHKPRGLVTSDHDPEGRATIADFLREHWPEGPRVVTIGRLDINTEGLLLLTNDGGLARVLELPQTGWLRRYRVRAKGMTDQAVLDGLADGVTLDGVDYAGIEAKLDRVQGSNCWLTMGLREGKNREVKRVLEHIGLEVNRLIRLSFGPFQLLDLPEGAVEEVRTRVLRDQLGTTLAAQADVDFGETAPAPDPSAANVSPRPQKPTRKADRPFKAADDARGRRSLGGAGVPRRDRDSRDDAPAPLRDRPIVGSRKHVSTLRAIEADAARSGPRKRIERADTRDRRDRTVQVERLVSSRPRAEPPSRRREDAATGSTTRGPRRGDGTGAAQDARPRQRASEHRPRTPTQDRPARETKPRAEARPPAADRLRDNRPDHRSQRTEGRRDDAPPRRHASPAALGKRERMARSGGAPATSRPAGSYKNERSFSANKAERRDNRDAETRPARRRPPRPEGTRDLRDPPRPEKSSPGDRPARKIPSDRKTPPVGETPSGHASSRPQRSAPRGRPTSEERTPVKSKPSRTKPFNSKPLETKTFKAKGTGGRPMGAASRKPSSRRPPGGRSPDAGGGKPPRGRPKR